MADLRELLDRAEAGDRVAATALARDPELESQARAAGGELGFRHACVALGHVLDHPGDYEDETARERYSALCDEHAADPARLARLRGLGERLHALERDGVLPRAMVVRSRRRRE